MDFFRHLKSEQVYHAYYPNYHSFKESIDEYIDSFNNKRPHHHLRCKFLKRKPTNFGLSNKKGSNNVGDPYGGSASFIHELTQKHNQIG